jgi:hypothetical protein
MLETTDEEVTPRQLMARTGDESEARLLSVNQGIEEQSWQVHLSTLMHTLKRQANNKHTGCTYTYSICSYSTGFFFVYALYCI